MAKLLLVEDDRSIIRLLELVFKENHELISTMYGEEVPSLIQQHNPDLIILDIELPDSNGMDLIPVVRETTQVPILMLSGIDTDLEKVTSFSFGADDYIVKPFSIAELQARIRVALRHYNMIKPQLEIISPRPTRTEFYFEIEQQRFFVNQQELILTNKEYNLLKLFYDKNNKVLTREYILDSIWGINNLEVDTRAVDACVSRLRKKLKSSLQDDVIKALSGLGYRMSV